MLLKEYGVEKFGRLIEQNIEQAQYLEHLIQGEAKFELVAPVNLNIVCFLYANQLSDEEILKELNTEIMLRVQESGFAVPSDTTVAGKHCLRVAINNHRTTRADPSQFVDVVLQHGRDLEAEVKVR